MEPIRICAVIATSHRTEWFARAVASLLAAERSCHGRIELTFAVADSAPGSGTVAAIRGILGEPTSSHAGRLLVLDRARHPVSAVVARNRVLSRLPHELDWVLFVDDDVYVEPGYLERFLKTSEAHPSADVIGGPNLTPPGSGWFQRATGVALSSRFATWVSVERYRRERGSRACGEEALILCNLFARREVMVAEPFPREFICAEENWWLLRLGEEGARMLHDPALFVWHERRSDLRSLVVQVFRYGCGRGQLIRRKPGSARLPHLGPSIALVALLVLGASAPAFPGAVGRALLGAFAVYLGMCVTAACLAAWKGARAERRVTPMAAILFPVIHSSYGGGVLWSLLRKL